MALRLLSFRGFVILSRAYCSKWNYTEQEIKDIVSHMQTLSLLRAAGDEREDNTQVPRVLIKLPSLTHTGFLSEINDEDCSSTL